MIINKFKRIVILFISLVLTITMFSYQQVNAADTANITLTNTGISYTLSVSATGSIEPYGTINKIYADGVLSLCIDALVDYGSGTHQQSILANELTANQKAKIKLIDYYAKLMGSETNNKLYATEQLYAWEVITGRTVTSLSNGLTLSEYKSYKAQIDSSIANHSKRPSFNGSNFTLEVGETKTFTDTNGILSKFVYSSSDSSVASVSQSGNTLTITSKKEGKVTLRAQLVNDKYVGTSLVYKKSGYQTKASFKLDDPGQSIVTVTNEISKGSLELGKQDTSGKWISGTKFNLSTSSSTSGLIGNYTTGSNGKVTVSNLNPGTYYYQETHVPSPLLIDTTWKKVTIKANEVTTEVAVNKIVIGKIEVNKQSTSGAKIANAKFNIVNSGGSVVDTVTTNANGVATSKELPLGSYSVIETSVPSPYILDATPIKVDLKYKDQVTPIVSNYVTQKNKEALGKIEVIKKNIGNDSVVANTKFEIYNSSNKLVETLTTDKNGKATSKELPLGKYTVIESYVPNPYILDATLIQVELKYKDQVTPVVTNSVTHKNKVAVGKIEVTKKNTNGEFVANAKFDIYNTNKELVQTLTTDSNGYAVSRELPLGKYTVKEVSVPSNLVLDDTSVNIELNYKDQLTPVIFGGITASNKFQRTNITLTKVENTWDQIFKENHGLELKGAMIELYAAKDIYEGQKNIYLSGELVGVEITNSVGQVKFHNLPIGEYYAIEKEAPKGYQLFTGKWYISAKYDSTNVKTEVTETQKTLENEVIYGRVNLVKTDGKHALLKDATFELYTSNDELITTLKTNENGRLITPDLRYGSYYLKELNAPIGYWLDPTLIPFTIEDHDKTLYVTAPNALIEAKIHVNKVDSENLKPLENAVFKILDLNTNEFVSIQFQEGKNVITKDEWMTDEDGEFLLEAFIPYGKYQLIETKAPEGYNLSDPIEFTIDEKQDFIELEIIGTVLKSTVTNRPIRSDIELLKVDALTGEALPNFMFKLTNLETGESTEEITDEDGLITFEKFKYGRYMIQEIEVDGEYLRDTSPQFIDIIEDSKLYKVTFENDKPVGEIKLLKLDYKDFTPVENAEYALYNKDDEILQKETTNEHGELTFTNVPLGEYYIKEESSPKGYILDDNTYEVNVKYKDEKTPIIHILVEVLETRTVEIKTSASFVSLDKVDPNITTLVDVVSYENLLIGKEYTIKGKLMNTKTGEEILIDNEPVRSEVTFIAEERDGTVEVFFIFDQSKLETETIVVFEDAYQEGILVATHHDLKDVEQTVEFPNIKTSASAHSFTKDKVVITDIVKYQNLNINQEYTLHGWIMNKDNLPLSDKEGNIIEASVSFIPEKENGKISMDFVIPIELLNKGEYVVFEQLFSGDYLIADHQDLTDENQTVYFTEIVINKIDANSKDVLQDVAFTLFDNKGNEIISYLTDELGKVRFLVPTGKYVVKETKALDGYVISNKKLKFKIKDKEENFEVSTLIENKKVPELPQTGSKSTLITAGIISLGFAALFVLYNKVRKYEKQQDEA